MDNHNQIRSVLLGRKSLRITSLLYNAYEDYIAARVLFNSGLLREACVLANQALEKQLKAYIEGQNEIEYKGHDTLRLLNIALYSKYGIASKINRDFVKVLNIVYNTRYLEKLPKNYTYMIVQYKFLAELDYIMSEFIPLMRIGEPGKSRSQYDVDLSVNEVRLFNNNYILNKFTKSDFLNQQQLSVEFLLHEHNPITVHSIINSCLDNGKFIYSGIKVISDNQIKITDWAFEEFGVSSPHQ